MRVGRVIGGEGRVIGGEERRGGGELSWQRIEGARVRVRVWIGIGIWNLGELVVWIVIAVLHDDD